MSQLPGRIFRKLVKEVRKLKQNRELRRRLKLLPAIQRTKVLILVFIPLNTLKAMQWHDGFTSAVKLLEQDHEVMVLNMDAHKPTPAEMNLFDVVLAKSAWAWFPDDFLRKQIPHLNTATGLLVSGVGREPSAKEMQLYDGLFYETQWYHPRIASHPLTIHAFGIDTDTIHHKPQIAKQYDWLTVGSLDGYKRQIKMIDKPGKRLVIGDIKPGVSDNIARELRANGVEIQAFVPYEQLTDIYNKAHNLYIPATIEGGGERAVLEGRACGLHVEIEPDNPKLAELLTSDIWDHHYYAQQLRLGIEQIIQARKDADDDKHDGIANSKRS